MADLQKQFITFHDAIAVKRSQEKAVLAEKRERILRRLSEGIARQRKAGVDIPSYRTVNQGSYRMGTGTKPKDGDFDLDVAVIFELDKNTLTDPVVVKNWVFEALKDHTARVQMRRPCVTVFYSEGGEPAYHVDLAVYADKNADGRTYLAIGKIESPNESRQWQESDPEALIAKIDTQCADASDRKQFRRGIRYLKRWRDENFDLKGNGAPRGIALTAAAMRWFVPAKEAFRNVYDDLSATRALVRAMLNGFTKVIDASGKPVDRLSVALPVAPGNDVFEKLSDAQMLVLRERLEKLWAALDDAKRDPDPHTAAKTLQKLLGDDFPVPEKVTTAAARAPTIVSSGNSG